MKKFIILAVLFGMLISTNSAAQENDVKKLTAECLFKNNKLSCAKAGEVALGAGDFATVYKVSAHMCNKMKITVGCALEGKLLLHGQGVAKDSEKAFDKLMSACDNGVDMACETMSDYMESLAPQSSINELFMNNSPKFTTVRLPLISVTRIGESGSASDPLSNNRMFIIMDTTAPKQTKQKWFGAGNVCDMRDVTVGHVYRKIHQLYVFKIGGRVICE